MPIPPSYADGPQQAAFFEWLKDTVNKSAVSKTRLARALGHDTTQQINRFLRGMLPMPETLKKLCEAMDVSWLGAFIRAGYYGEVLSILADLERLAVSWKSEDCVYPTDDRQFRSVGVIKINGISVIDALNQPKYRGRYHLGCYQEAPHEIHPDEALPLEQAAFFKEQAANPRPVCCVVPKPMAVAIFIAVAGFARRGDIYKDGQSIYAANIIASAAPLIDLAIAKRSRRSSLPPLLQKVLDALKDKQISLDMGRIIAAEFITSWADSLCRAYTYYARLAMFAYWGEAGSSVSTRTPYTQMPQIRIAKPPDLAQLTSLT